MSRFKHWVIGAGLLLLAAGCGARKPFIRAGFAENPPKRIAVLPFVITYAYDQAEGRAIPASHIVGRDTLRKTFYYGLKPYGYEDIRLADVDAQLQSRWGPLEEGGWRKATARELGEALGADALIYGDVSRLMHFTTPLYTETSLAASVRMVDAASGEELWRQHTQVAERGGALMKKGQVVDFVKDQVRSFKPEVKFLRISDTAIRQLLAGFPNRAMDVESQSAASSSGRRLRLAVLPFDGKPKWKAQVEQMRFDMIANIPEDSFDVIEPARADAALKALGWSGEGPLPEPLALAELAQALDADLILRGTVTRLGRTYMVVESWVKAEMQADLLDAHGGDVIWSAKRANTRHAGILKGPTGYKSVATAPISGLKTSNLQRVATHLARELAREMAASPAVAVYIDEHKPAS